MMISHLKQIPENFIENYTGSILKKFVAAVDSGRKRFIFNGPAGVGKSFLADAVAGKKGFLVEKINLYLLENVDDTDISDLIYNTVYNSVKSRSLFDDRKKVVFVEDIEKILSVDPSILDKLSGVEDAIIIFQSETGEIFRAKNKRHVSGYELIQFYRLNETSVRAYVIRLARQNGLALNDITVERIAKNSRGNLQSAFTDMATIAISGSAGVELPPRNGDDGLFERIDAVFSGDLRGISTHFASDTDAKNFAIWLADKAPQAYRGSRLSQFFEKLSLADILIRKIKKQNWGLMRYVQDLLFNGTASISGGTRTKVTRFAPNWELYYSQV